LLARIRGDATDASILEAGAALVKARGIASDGDLGSLLDGGGSLDTHPLLRQKLQQMYDAGAWVLMESAIADLPADLRWLFESGGITITQLAALHQQLGVTTAADLADAVEHHAIRSVPGLDEATEAAVARALPALRSAVPRIPLGRAVTVVEPLLERLRAAHGVEWAMPVGSLRRGDDTVGDIEIVSLADKPEAIIETFSRLPETGRILHRSDRRLYLLLERVQLGLRFPEAATAANVLLQLTGSRAHLERLSQVAHERHVSLREPAITEEEIYARLGLPFIPPEIRNGSDELRAALEGSLPRLVSRGDIRGDLHMHSLWSDGRDSIEAMVTACMGLGYEYIAITDHSPRAASSRTLTLDGVKRQADEIARLRQRYPDIAILHGCEVDILRDGRLDFGDRVLRQFDIVLASLHDGSGQSPAQLERRYMAAMRHPLVTAITHPTNRLVPYRRGYDLDYDRLFEVAAETGTVVEIDGAPAHLDLDGALARRAIAAGATVVIDSDCHRAEFLDRQMGLGVLMARRGWVEARHVLNARPLAEVRAAIVGKRGP
jgi:DNA polymerase (family 10)